MILSDNLYVARKEYICDITGDKIPKGAKYLKVVQKVEKRFFCVRVCKRIIDDYFWMLDAFGNLIDEYGFDKEMYFDILKDE